MTSMVVGIDTYDLLLGLDFFIKIRIIIDVEKGMIQMGKVLG
jgi:hypothetical protein